MIWTSIIGNLSAAYTEYSLVIAESQTVSVLLAASFVFQESSGLAEFGAFGVLW